MSIGGVLQTGVQGFQSSVQGMERAASEIARVGTTSADSSVNSFVEPVMDLKLYELSAEASSKVVKTADEMLGTLLDTVA